VRIVLIGQQDFGKAVLDALRARGDTVVGVFCAPERPGSRPDPLRAAAQEASLPVFQLASLKGDAARATLAGLKADLGIMAYVLQFAPAEFVSVPRLGTIQFHPSLLPRYRGPSSINWPIIRGDTHTGLSIFRPTEGLDEGPVILQREVPIGPDDTLGSVYFEHLFPLGVQALLEAADQVRAGTAQEQAQDESQASYEGWCRGAESHVNWHNHIDTVYNLIRGCDPAPGAWTLHDGEKLHLFGASKHPTRRFGDIRGRIGECIAIGEDSMHINTHGGVIEVHRVRPEDGSKMPAAQYCAENGLAVGTVLGS